MKGGREKEKLVNARKGSPGKLKFEAQKCCRLERPDQHTTEVGRDNTCTFQIPEERRVGQNGCVRLKIIGSNTEIA